MEHAAIIAVARGEVPPLAGATVALHSTEPSFYVLEGGMESGRCSVAIVAHSNNDPNGPVAIIEVPVRMLRTAATAIVAMAERFGDDLTEP